MKKILLSLLVIFLITGCGQNKQIECNYYYEESGIRVDNSHIIYFDTMDNLQKIEYMTYIYESAVAELTVDNWCSYVMQDYSEKVKNIIECSSTQKDGKITVKMTFNPDSFSSDEFDTYFGDMDNTKKYNYETIKQTIEKDETKKAMCTLEIDEQAKSIKQSFNEKLMNHIIEDKREKKEKLENISDKYKE